MAERGKDKLATILDDAVHDRTVRAVAASAVAAGGALAAGKLMRDRVSHDARAEADARTYRLLPGEAIADAIRRIARGQLEHASEVLKQADAEGLPDAIHDARKSLKRTRALIRLARDGLGEQTYRRENGALRDAGRELSDVRDAHVTVKTLEQLESRFADEIPDGAFRGLRDALSVEARSAHARVQEHPEALASVLEALESARTRVATWPLPDGYDLRAVAPSFERTYRRGRHSLRRARKRPDTERLHELRKRAKDLWHASQVLRPAAPKKMKQLGRRAHRLADIVGADHDLAVLLEQATHRAATLADGELELLTALVGRRRAALKRDGLRQARRVYARKPGKLAHRIADSKARRRLGRQHAQSSA